MKVFGILTHTCIYHRILGTAYICRPYVDFKMKGIGCTSYISLFFLLVFFQLLASTLFHGNEMCVLCLKILNRVHEYDVTKALF